MCLYINELWMGARMVSSPCSSLFWGPALKLESRKGGFYFWFITQPPWGSYTVVLCLNFRLCESNLSHPRSHGRGFLASRWGGPANEPGRGGAAFPASLFSPLRVGTSWWLYSWHGERMERGLYHIPIVSRPTTELSPHPNLFWTTL